MPLLDHFHAPLSSKRSWESFHSRWADSIGDWLNGVLPSRFFTEIQNHLGSRVEADVAEFEETNGDERRDANSNGGVAVQTYKAPAATFVMPAEFTDSFEIHIRDERQDSRLVAVIELVSPRNKDRPQSRTDFAAKCLTYLRNGVGLMTVDVVTNHHFNLHNELIGLLELSEEFAMSNGDNLYAVSYRPVRIKEENQIQVWTAHLRINERLPTLPLGLKGWEMIPVDLEAAYADACRRSRI